jgi:pyrroline-5-carboxylate reductase
MLESSVVHQLASSRIAFVGGGNMARSLIGGLLARGLKAEQLCVFEPNAELRAALARDFGIAAAASNADAVRTADVVVLAVKPQVMRTACSEFAFAVRSDAVIVSIAAGITTAQLKTWLGAERGIVRSMPNTPALLGAGATGLFATERVDAAGRTRANALMASVGVTVWIESEALMDAVTALSGSGPAYVFLLAEAMQAGGEAQGLPSNAARALTVQTLLGAARMLAEAGESAAELRNRVTSPGGTTQAALESFEAAGFRVIVADALEAATARGRVLSAAAEQ